MWASKLLKGRNARSFTKQSVATAASAPTSKADFSANSQAFSVAVTELLECLDFVLDQLDDQGMSMKNSGIVECVLTSAFYRRTRRFVTVSPFAASQGDIEIRKLQGSR
jgi:hypothetical protein